MVRPRVRVRWKISWRTATGEIDEALWHTMHCESLVWIGWALRSQAPLPRLHTALKPNEAQLASLVQAPPLGVPKVRGGLSVPVSKNRLSWQVPQPSRLAWVQRSSVWQVAQSRSPLGMAGKPTLTKSA